MTAMFVRDQISDKFLPANNMAVAQCAILSKMRLTSKDLLTVKAKGIRVIYPNGVDIETSELA